MSELSREPVSLPEAKIIGLAIRQVRERIDLEPEEVERSAGLGHGEMSAIEDGRIHPHWGDLRCIAYAMQVPLPQIMVEAGRIEAEHR